MEAAQLLPALFDSDEGWHTPFRGFDGAYNVRLMRLILCRWSAATSMEVVKAATRPLVVLA